MKHANRSVHLAVIILTAAIIYAIPGAAQTCPEMVGRWPYGPANALEVSGTTAYVAMGSALKIIDISDPAAPVELGTIVVPGAIGDLTVAGSHAFLAAGRAGLRIIDVSTPAAPVEVGFYDFMGPTTNVTVSGTHAYVTSWDNLWIFDIASPSYPDLLEIFVYWTGFLRAIAVSGGHAFIVVEDGIGVDLVVVDISDPFNPVEVGAFDSPASRPADVVVDGTYAYLADETGLRLLDISDPTSPSEVGVYSLFFGAQSVAVDGSYAYLGVSTTSLHGVGVIDVSTPNAPLPMASFDTPGAALGIAASGHQVFVAAGSAGLRIVDWWQGVELGFVDAPGSTRDVAVSGTTAFLVDSEGLRVMDVSSTATPTELGFHEGGGEDIEISGPHAFVAAGADGLRVFDVSDPTAPVEVGLYDTPSWANSVAVSGGFAYVADSNALRVVDVGIPTAPVEVGSLTMTAIGVAVDGSRAYVADGSGLRVIDISDPMAPTELGSLTTNGVAVGVAVSGSTAYVAAIWGGLRVIDVSDPANPSEAGALDSSNGFFFSPSQIALSGSVAYLTDGSLVAVDVSIPTAPVEVGFARTPGIARSLTTSGGHVFVADASAGLTIFSQCALGPDEVFSDGFESGDLAVWSNSAR